MLTIMSKTVSSTTQVLRSDNFTRADTTNNIGTPSDGGSPWAQVSGIWGIASNQGYDSNGATYEIAYLESSNADVSVEVTINGTNAGNFAGLCARVADDSNHLLLRVSTPGASGTIDLFKRVAGTYTQLGSPFVGLVTNGDVFKLTMSVNGLIAYQNGVSIITANDGAGASNTKHGLYSNGVFSRFTNFSITSP